MITRDEVERIVDRKVQPMHRGAFAKISGLLATLKDLIPFGQGDQFQHAMPFGLVSRPIPGTQGYFLNLLGRAQGPVIVTHLDLKRPVPSADGETILYSLNADGSLTPVRLTLGADGHYVVAASNIKIGSSAAAENLVLGQQLKSLLSDLLSELKTLTQRIENHTHVGNLGFATGVPIQIADFETSRTSFDSLKSSPVDDSAILSDKAFTEKS